MDILDVMDLLDVGHPLTNRNSPLLDDSDEMEPNNLSQSAVRISETLTTSDGEGAAAAQAFTEPSLELKLPILSSSSSESESEEPANATAGTSTGVEGDRTASPPPNCAICLGRCKNKCFTDSCMHQFCFKCLCEWSKVKPECPLCKQTFKSIIHNVKSIHQFEEYHVQPPTVQIAHPPFEMDIFDVVYPGHNRIQAWNGSNYRPYYFESSALSTAAAGGSLPTASGSNSNRLIPNAANGSGLRNQYVYRGELLDLYRQEYPGAIANSGTLSQLWRRYVYDRKLYAMPVADITGRFRESSARFYRDNPSQIHRLMPWINRDIVCLLRQTQHDVTTVLESINSALTIMNILSPAFRRRLQPFLCTKTAHFIHELNNFARSPYDMIGYDRAVQYSPQTNNEEIVIEFTSSDESTDNDQIDVSGDGSNNNATSSSSRTRATNATSINAINLTIHNRLTSSSANIGGIRGGVNNVGINSTSLSEMQDDVGLVIDLRGESDNNETTSTAQATNNSSNYLNGQNASASESDMVTSGNQPVVSENIELTSGSSDECEFVLERKPPHLRTPEMVSLDSASDSDVVFVDESKALNKTSFSSSDGEMNEDASEHKHNSRHHSKIAALVEAKKRNQSANLVKSEQQESHTEVYNLGASTSAALRLSLQKQVDKSRRSDGGTSSKRQKRSKYCLRKIDGHSRTERQTTKNRGKRLDSESSHSSTSSFSTSSSSTTTSSSQSSSTSSDEDYMGSTQRKKITSTARGAHTMRKGSDKAIKTKKRKATTSKNRRAAKRDTRKQKKNNYSTDDDDDDDEDENGHLGKNFALVMAINLRRKMQNQKKCSNKFQENQQEESEGENSWRLKAVNEPLRKQQEQRVKGSHKSNERKRQHKATTQQHHDIESISNRKLQKLDNQQSQNVKETERAINGYNTENTSSDESDNINLIQLKTKLTGQVCHKQLNMAQTSTSQRERENEVKSETETTTNNVNNSENDTNDAVTSTFATTTENLPIPTADMADATETLSNSPSSARVAPTNIVEAMIPRNGLYNFSDDSNDSIENNNGHGHIDNNNNDSVDQQHLHSASSNNYQVNNQENSPHINNDDNANHNDHNVVDDETLTNGPTTMNLNESNVFADGASMSTTTNDTILHETAEQISSAAVNFYNPQQTFNTADFVSEHSTNSSSDSSVSSTTTGVLTSSGSSSYINYESS